MKFSTSTIVHDPFFKLPSNFWPPCNFFSGLTFINILRSSNIIWVDLEMTGLDVDKDFIMEIACIITDKHLNTLAEGPNIVIHQVNHAPAGNVSYL